MKNKILSLTKKPWFTLTMAIILLVCAVSIYFLTRPPAPQEIPMGFTMIAATSEDEINVTTLEEVGDVSLMYTSGMLFIDTKSNTTDDPMMVGGVTWFYRVNGGSPYTVYVMNSQGKVAQWDNIMMATNQCTKIPGLDEPCAAGAVKLLDTNLETIYVETTPQQYILINPVGSE